MIYNGSQENRRPQVVFIVWDGYKSIGCEKLSRNEVATEVKNTNRVDGHSVDVGVIDKAYYRIWDQFVVVL